MIKFFTFDLFLVPVWRLEFKVPRTDWGVPYLSYRIGPAVIRRFK